MKIRYICSKAIMEMRDTQCADKGTQAIYIYTIKAYA